MEISAIMIIKYLYKGILVGNIHRTKESRTNRNYKNININDMFFN